MSFCTTPKAHAKTQAPLTLAALSNIGSIDVLNQYFYYINSSVPDLNYELPRIGLFQPSQYAILKKSAAEIITSSNCSALTEFANTVVSSKFPGGCGWSTSCTCRYTAASSDCSPEQCCLMINAITNTTMIREYSLPHCSPLVAAYQATQALHTILYNNPICFPKLPKSDIIRLNTFLEISSDSQLTELKTFVTSLV